jgi:SHAQKYF class myb-like DNA-binding protein
MDTNDVPLRRVSPPLAAADQSQNAVGSSEHHQPLSSSSIMQVMNQPLSPVHSPQSNAAHLVDSLFLPSFDGVPVPESHTDNDDDFLDLEQIMMCAMEEGEEHQAEDTAKSEVMSIVNKMVGDATMDLLNDKVTVVNHKYTNSYEELSDQEDFKVPSAPTSTVPKEAVPDGTSKQDKRSNTPKVSSPNNGRWKKEEHALFLEALDQHGKNWQKISAHVKTRTAVQSRTHAQKYYQKLAKMEKAKEGKKRWQERYG